MLVLVLLGLAALLVVPTVSRGLKNREARQAALAFAALARDLSNRARAEGIPQRLVVDKMRNSYRITRHQEVALPPSLTFAAVEGGEILEQGLHRFSFFANGASFGGRIDFSLGGAEPLYSVRFHPLTGRVEVLRGTGR
jgi:type II secretory pathway pseudopilin PulG